MRCSHASRSAIQARLRCYRCKNEAVLGSASPLKMTTTSCTFSAEGFWIVLEFRPKRVMHLCTIGFYKLQVVLVINQCIMQHIGHDKQAAECAKISLSFVCSNAQRSYSSTVCVNHSGCCSGVDEEEAAVTQSANEGHRAENALCCEVAGLQLRPLCKMRSI